MSLSEKTVLGKIEITDGSLIQVRVDRIIYDNDVELHRSYHRKILEPGDDVSTENNQIKEIAKLLWTSKIIKEWEAKKRAKIISDQP